mmetsp:Transcript_92715/g.247905  ORF Transcript_92715/g.247905 Transcript_92715/m.247905 type:complete len:219 (-) Transcript_92715:613-1269(-)
MFKSDTSQKPNEPHRKPRGRKVPPPLSIVRVTIPTKQNVKSPTFRQGTRCSRARIASSAESDSQLSRIRSDMSPASPSARADSKVSAAERWGFQGPSRCDDCGNVANCPPPSASRAHTSASSAAVSAAHILVPLAQVLRPTSHSTVAKLTVSPRVGTHLLMKAPTTAPAMVSGSMTRIRSQSISGRCLNGWVRGAFSTVLEMAPPKIATLESATACFA